MRLRTGHEVRKRPDVVKVDLTDAQFRLEQCCIVVRLKVVNYFS